MRNRLYEQAFYLFRKMDGMAQSQDQLVESELAPLLREFSQILGGCLEHADSAVFYGKRGKLGGFGQDRKYGILQEEFILVHFLQELQSSVLYMLNRIETDESLLEFSRKLRIMTLEPAGDNQGFAAHVLESLGALKETDTAEFQKMMNVLAKRYEIGNKLFSLLQDLQHFR